MHNILNQAVLLKSAILQNPWFISGIIAGATAIIVIPVLILIIVKRRKPKKDINTYLTNIEELPNKKPEENYELITERIKRVEKKYKSILFASVEPGSLPITIPVNVAIGLTKNKKRCLLIDLDLKRDAIAEAFELNTRQNDLRPKAIRTEFENLWVWPGHNFAQLKQMNIKAIVQKARDKFDFILINTPSLADSPDCKQIISSAQAAFICTKDASEATKLAELIKPSDCMVIGHIQIPQQD